MKFNTTDAPEIDPPHSIVGNVYRCMGGRKSGYWIVVAVHVNTVVVLGLNNEGEITSSSNYGLHVFYGNPWSREPVGRVIEMPDLNFVIEWNRLNHATGRG